jgi:hypothetical protein
MKPLKSIPKLTLFFAILFSMSSCLVLVHEKDNGKHKGWNKNSNNPHHSNSTNPGKGNKK